MVYNLLIKLLVTGGVKYYPTTIGKYEIFYARTYANHYCSIRQIRRRELLTSSSMYIGESFEK